MKREAATACLVLAAATVLFLAAFQGPSPLFLDFGPNDGAYVRGFREEFEIDEPTLIHWSLRRGRVELPVRLPRGPVSVRFRYKRHMALPADVRVFFAGRQIDRFEAPQQDFRVRTVTVEENPRPWQPVEITFLSRSPDPRPLGLALDWLEVRPSRGLVLPTYPSLGYLWGMVLGLYVLPRLMGFSRKAAMALALAGAGALGAAALAHKLWPLHAASTLGLRFHVASALVVFACRGLARRPGSAFAHPAARWALLAFYLGTTLRLVGLFHPDFYYPDVRTHSKFVSVIWTEGLGGFFTRHIENQHRYLLGLQLVDQTWLAFPYPPLLYLGIYPLSLLQLPVDDWMKLVPTVLVGVEALMVYAIGFHLGLGARASAIAASLHATARLVAFRLAVASFPALFGHFWDVVIGLYLVLFFSRMKRIRYGLGLGALVALSLLSYAGSVLVLGIFVPTFAAAVALWRPAQRAEALRAALWSLGGAGLALVVFYLQYIPELLPQGLGRAASAGGAHLIDVRLTPMAALRMALHRLLLFYGPLFGPLVVLGFPWAGRKIDHSLGRPLAVASCVTFLGLNFLRSGLGETHVFQFSKDALVLLPLAALVLGNLVDVACGKGRWACRLAALLAAVWVGWGVMTLARNVRARFIRPDYDLTLMTPTERRSADLSSRPLDGPPSLDSDRSRSDEGPPPARGAFLSR